MLLGEKFRVRKTVGSKFSTLAQTYTAAHLSFFARGTGFFPGIKRPRCGLDHLVPSRVEVKERVQLYL